MSNTNTIYLVDLENIGTKPLCTHVEQHQDVEHIVFYLDNTNTPEYILERIPETAIIRFVNCKTGRNNAMDFCICAAAGQLSTNRFRKICILSNDKGYDPMIGMLQEQGIRIIREKTNNTDQSMDIENESVFTNPDYTVLMSAIHKHVPKKYQEEVQKRVTHETTRKQMHEICQMILPQSIATETYRKLRKTIPRG